MGGAGGECDYVGGGAAEDKEGEDGGLGDVGLGRADAGEIGDMRFIDMGKVFVLELVGCCLHGALDGVLGTSKCIEVTLAFHVLGKRLFAIPTISIYP